MHLLNLKLYFVVVDSSVASLNRSIRETVLQTEKSKKEQKTLSDNISLLRTQVLLEKIRRDSLTAELSTLNKKLEDLRKQSVKFLLYIIFSQNIKISF